MSASQHIQIAKRLPPRLIRFFERFPPPSFLPQSSTPIPTNASIANSSIPQSTASADLSVSTHASQLDSTSSTIPSRPTRAFHYPHKLPPSAETDLPYANPFLPVRSHLTGRWRGPTYGLRQQADLVKLASEFGVVDLLPWTIKKPGEKEKRRIEQGLQVKGTGMGDRVKGKKWERTLKGRLDKRKKAMEGMGALVQEWKQRGHGRGWKKWPSGKATK